jgi:hypothetical protein
MAMLALAVILVWAVALYQLATMVERCVKTMPCFYVDTAKLCVEQLPDWLQRYTEKLVPQYLSDHSLNIFAADVVRTVASAYLQNPWVEQVVSVKKSYPNQLHVTLSLRRPLAWIVFRQRAFLCDVHATRLPVEIATEEVDNLPLVYGVASEVPLPGRKWREPNLLAALHVIALLQKNDLLQLFPCSEIHLEPQATSRQIVLVARNPSVRVVWGESPGSEFPNVSSAKRMIALRHVAQILQQLDEREYSNIEQFDIRFGYVIAQAKETKDKTWRTSSNSKKM